MPAKRVVIGNNKGGTGKTTAVTQIAAALAEMGKRVLVVDMDPQANTSRRLGVPFDPEHPTAGVSEAIRSGEPGVAADVVVSCQWPAPYSDLIDLIPSRFDLENRVSEAGVLGAVGRLARSLEGVDDDHDITLIDSPPSLGHLTQLALAAADGAVCPMEPEYEAVEGAVRFRDFVQTKQAELGNPDLSMLGFLVCRVRSNVGAHAFQIEGLADAFGDENLWKPYVPERAAIKDAADTASPLRGLGSTGNEMSWIYAQHATRLLESLGLKSKEETP